MESLTPAWRAAGALRTELEVEIENERKPGGILPLALI